MPPQQGLVARERAGCAAHKRLVVELHPLAFDRGPQVALQRPAFLQGRVHRRFEHAEHVAAFRLGPVHGDVGAAQQLLPGLPIVREQGHADGHADRHRLAVDRKRFGHLLDDPLRRGTVGVRRIGRQRQHDGELVAAQPCDEIVRAHGRRQAFGHRGQQLVARGVAQSVVDRLEPLEVQAQHRDPAVGACRLLQHLAQSLVEQHPVAEAGQRVIVRHETYFGVCLVPFGHVLVGRHPTAAGHRPMQDVDHASVAVRVDERVDALALRKLQSLPPALLEIDRAERPGLMT